jgi:drug/metabolite transporter (DMT)-like permease
MGLPNNAVPFTLFALAQGQINGSLAAILNATPPLFTVVVARLARAERMGLARVAALVLGFCGDLVMLAGTESGSAVPARLACLGAAVSCACAGVWGRRFKNLAVSPLATAFGHLACSAALIMPVWLWREAPWAMSVPGAQGVGAVVVLAVLSTALAYLLYFRLLASSGATNLSLVSLLIPVTATLMGWGLPDAALETHQILGFSLTAAGLLLMDGRLPHRCPCRIHQGPSARRATESLKIKPLCFEHRPPRSERRSFAAMQDRFVAAVQSCSRGRS